MGDRRKLRGAHQGWRLPPGVPRPHLGDRRKLRGGTPGLAFAAGRA